MYDYCRYGEHFDKQAYFMKINGCYLTIINNIIPYSASITNVHGSFVNIEALTVGTECIHYNFIEYSCYYKYTTAWQWYVYKYECCKCIDPNLML